MTAAKIIALTPEQLHVELLKAIDAYKHPDSEAWRCTYTKREWNLHIERVHPLDRDLIESVEKVRLKTDEDMRRYFHQILLITVGFYEDGNLPCQEFEGFPRDKNLHNANPEVCARALLLAKAKEES